MEIKQLMACLEAILFASGEPMEIDKAANALEIDNDTVKDVAKLLGDKLNKDESALCLLCFGDKLQLCTRTEYMPYIKKALELRRNTPLSQAAMEVLAIISYNQPVTKAFVEQVRGVDCSGVISSLCDKELVEEKGRLDLPGRPLLYGTTDVFLRCFSLPSIESLPPLPVVERVAGEELQLQDAQIGENME